MCSEPVVAISTDTALMEGETAILACVGYGQPSVAVTWTRNGMPVMNSSSLTAYEEVTTVATLPFTRSFLQFCSAQSEDSGVYTCTATSGRLTDSSTVQMLG